MKFIYLRKAAEKYAAEAERSDIFYIRNGFRPTWAERERNDRERGLKEFSTAARWEQYQSGKITRAKAVELASERARKEGAKRRAGLLAKIEAAENAAPAVTVSASLEWVRSRVWGYNPKAEADIYNGDHWERTHGSASGCGYDKGSAALCEAMNASPAVLAVLYAAEDNRLKGRETRKQPRADVLGYGSGYGVLPYFEGGCGVSCVANIFTRCGYVFEYGKSGEHFNTYYIKKGGAKE